VEVRIGVTHAKELQVELADDTDRDALVKDITGSLSDDDNVLWITDRRGRSVAVPASKVAYVEIDSGATERRVGFGGT
jgi:hypothetical protein